MIAKIIKKIKLRALGEYKRKLRHDSGMIRHVGVDVLIVLVKKNLA